MGYQFKTIINFLGPGDNITNPYDPNYGQVNPYPTQSIGPAGTAQHVPVQHQPPPGTYLFL